MYQDDAEPPNTTIGIGTNLTANGAADAAVNLLLGKAVLKASSKRQPATAEQIRQEYNTVSALNLTNSAGRRSLASEYEPHTTMVIGRSVARQFAEDHIRPEMIRVVDSGDYPDLDKRSKSAQIAESSEPKVIGVSSPHHRAARHFAGQARAFQLRAVAIANEAKEDLPAPVGLLGFLPMIDQPGMEGRFVARRRVLRRGEAELGIDPEAWSGAAIGGGQGAGTGKADQAGGKENNTEATHGTNTPTTPDPQG